MNQWEAVFTQSPANYGYYNEEELTVRYWEWPQKTWLQGRLQYLREHEPAAVLKSLRTLRRRRRTDLH